MKHAKLTLSIVAIAAAACIAASNANQPSSTSQAPPTDATRPHSSGVVQVAVQNSPTSGVNAAYGYSRPVSVSRTAESNVIVVPDEDIDPQKMASTVEDMRIMSHIVEQNITSAAVDPAAAGVFSDFGPFFMTGDVGSQAIYIEGYGALFMMNVDFPLAAPPAPPEKQPEPNEPVDKTWQQARMQVLSPGMVPGKPDPAAAVKFDAERIEQLKQKLIKALGHATNMRNLAADESVVIRLSTRAKHSTVIRSLMKMMDATGQGGMSVGGMGMAGGYGGYGGAAFGGGASSGYSSDPYSSDASADPAQDQVAESTAAKVRAGVSSSSAGKGRTSSMATRTGKSPSTMTIRAKKSDIDAFSKGEINLEQFTSRVKIIVY